MYSPKFFLESRINVLHQLIEGYPLASWVVQTNGELLVNHIPFELDKTQGEYGVLKGHVARANPVWCSLSQADLSVIIFHGPASYISPSWYPSKQQHGKVVPTWNYIVVHAQGKAVVIEEQAWLLRHIKQFTDSQEAAASMPWQVSDAPQAFIEQLSQAIVGIEIPITSLTGKWKLSQNRSLDDKLGVIAGLRAKGETGTQTMADIMQAEIDQTDIKD